MRRYGRKKILIMACTTVVVTASMILARLGILPVFVFYTLLIAMHALIFTRIGIRIYNFKQNKK